jgi:hypothetical protein
VFDGRGNVVRFTPLPESNGHQKKQQYFADEDIFETLDDLYKRKSTSIAPGPEIEKPWSQA